MSAKTGSTKDVQRLNPTPSTIKKLFAYSGNECAIPGCQEPLVDKTGTMLGKIAHIHAAEKGGARFDRGMTDEERRAFDNLFIVCGKHHDIIDDPKNGTEFTAELLKKYKSQHEERFKRAEKQLLESIFDQTQIKKPTFPKNLNRLAKYLKVNELAERPEEIEGINDFIQSLKEVPIQDRQFALKLAERMHRNDVSRLPVEDVRGAFGMSNSKLKDHIRVLEHWGLGYVDEGFQPGQYYVRLSNRKPDGNPWFEILDFCEASGDSPNELIFDLNFALYDG